MVQITESMLSSIFTNTSFDILQQYTPILNSFMPDYEIDTKFRVAMFLAQCGHESGGFRTIQENLYYRADRLLQVFPRYFNASQAQAYANNPERIANRVYANRMGNGSESSGDGYKFRGRGLIQITGKSNYSALAQELKLSLDDTTNYLLTPEGAVESACWFFEKNGCNQKSDYEDVVGVTRIINGGENGLADRRHLYSLAKRVIV